MKFEIPNQTEVLLKNGITNQTLQWQEDIAQLTRSLHWCWKNPSQFHKSILAEDIANVLLNIQQMCLAYNISTPTIQDYVNKNYESQLAKLKGDD